MVRRQMRAHPIKHLRIAWGVTRAEMAHLLGVYVGTITGLENWTNGDGPRYRVMSQLALALGISLDEARRLVDGDVGLDFVERFIERKPSAPVQQWVSSKRQTRKQRFADKGVSDAAASKAN